MLEKQPIDEPELSDGGTRAAFAVEIVGQFLASTVPLAGVPATFLARWISSSSRRKQEAFLRDLRDRVKNVEATIAGSHQTEDLEALISRTLDNLSRVSTEAKREALLNAVTRAVTHPDATQSDFVLALLDRLSEYEIVALGHVVRLATDVLLHEDAGTPVRDIRFAEELMGKEGVRSFRDTRDGIPYITISDFLEAKMMTLPVASSADIGSAPVRTALLMLVSGGFLTGALMTDPTRAQQPIDHINLVEHLELVPHMVTNAGWLLYEQAL